MLAQDEFLRKIIQYLNDPENELLQVELDQITKKSSKQKRIFDQTVLLWNNTAGLQIIDDSGVDEAVLKLEARLIELQGKGVKRDLNPKVSLIKQWAAIAAVLAVGIIAYWGYSTNNNVKFLVKTTQGAIDSVTLADGSKIFLDEFSELKYPDNFNGDKRVISLTKGQAFFKVHRDTLHPFVVNIRNSSVTVLGTSFNIDSRDAQIALNVKTGKVKFQPLADQSAGEILPAGTGIIYDEAKNAESIVPSFNYSNQYWLNHEIDFVDASLIEVCKQLEVCYKVKISLDSKASAFKKFNAHFKDNKLNDIIEVLRNTYPIKIDKLDNGSLIIKSAINPPSLNK